MVKLTINNIPIEVEKGTTVLDAAKKVGVHVPTLCYLDLHDFGVVNKVASCRICVVEQKGKESLVPSCAEVVFDGMEIVTDSVRALNARRNNLELLLSNHPFECLTCRKNLRCELQSLAQELNIRDVVYHGEKMQYPLDISSLAVVHDPEKCVMCRRCETMCNDIQTVGVLSAINRGFEVVMAPAFNLDMVDTSCTNCGQCVAVCPTGALTEMRNLNIKSDAFKKAIDDKKMEVKKAQNAFKAHLDLIDFQIKLATSSADRLKMELILDSVDLKADNKPDINGTFLEIGRYKNGNLDLVESTGDSKYAELAKTLASRTYAESGDYYVSPFDVSVKESLNDGLGNRGIFNAGQFTYAGSTPSNNLAIYQISPGKAFVKGYEIETISPTFLDLPKTRTTKTLENQSSWL